MKDNHRAGRKVSKISKTAEATIQKLMNTNARYTIPELAKVTGISINKAHFILKKRLHARKNFTYWIPHLLPDYQTRARVTYAKKVLKNSPNFDKIKLLTLLQVLKPVFNFINHSEKLEIKFGQRKVPNYHVLPGGQ